MNSSATNPAAGDRIEPWVWRLSGIVVLGTMMSILDTTIVNVALPSLSRDLHSPISEIQWVVTGYLLSLAAVIPVAGWTARRYGPKSVYMISLVLFTAGSALCGLATSSTELILFRVIQGVGGGMIAPIGQLMMATAAGPSRMGRVMSIVAVPAMLAPILGPVIGGLILDSTTWRWIFFVNVPVGALAILLAWRGLPRGERAPAGRLDVVGLLLLATGIPAITYGLAEIGTTGSFGLVHVGIPVVGGVLLVAAFCVNALRVERPLLDLRLYRRRTFSAASVAMFFLGGALFGAMILMPLYYQEVRHEDVLVTGLLMGPSGLGAALVMPFAGRLTDRFGGGPLALLGVIVLALSSVPFGLIGADTSIVALSFALFARGIGIGLAMIPAMAAAYSALRPEELSDATPQMNVLQRVGGSIGVAVLAVVLQRAIASAGGAHATPASFAGAFGTAYWWALGIAALAIVPCVVLLREERRVKAARVRELAARVARAEPEPAAPRSGRRLRGEMLEVGIDTEREQASLELGRAFKGTLAAVRRLRGRETHRPGELSHAQYSLLAELAERGEMAAGELAVAAALAPATVTQMLDHLAAAGLVVRTRSERDRRVVVTALAPDGRALVSARQRSIEPLWRAALEDFSGPELRTAAAVLERLREFFEGLDERERT